MLSARFHLAPSLLRRAAALPLAAARPLSARPLAASLQRMGANKGASSFGQIRHNTLRAAFSTQAAPAAASTNSSSSSSSNSSSSDSSSSDSSSSGPDFNSDSFGSDRGLAYWLLGCSGLVFAMVSLGGLTRLTKSGLSMVEWRPASFLPPRNEEEWQIEFKKYQQYPEYHKVNNQMSLSDFQFIYNMEFSHRLLGRCIGIAFAVPGLYFLARGRINARLGSTLAVAFAAGGAQGAIGWWMVKSGLEQPHQSQQTANVHVSPYRLATHLISAFAIYALLFNTALRVHPSRFSSALRAGTPAFEGTKQFFSLPQVKNLQRLVGVSTAFVATTVFSGAFVAGNEAGLVYNEFPLMGGRLIPEDLTSPYIHPEWRNIFEHSTLVQFNHRVLAMSTTALVAACFVMTRRLRKSGEVAKLLQNHTLLAERYKRMLTASHAAVGMVAVQVTLGITTLIYHVPVSLATLHQAGSLSLLTFALALLYTMRNPTAAKQVQRLMAQHAARLAKGKLPAAAPVLTTAKDKIKPAL